MDFRFFVCLLLTAAAFSSCHEKTRDCVLTLDSLTALRDEATCLRPQAIRTGMERMAYADKGTSPAARYTRNYYLGGGNMLWLTRMGVSSVADSVLRYAGEAEEWGFDRENFHYTAIRNDLRRVRELDFSGEGNDINTVFARLEYRLTKAYLLYCSGQRFGYVSPRDLFNRIEVRDSDSVRVTYNALFDIPMQRADKAFFAESVHKVQADSAAVWLRESRPQDPFYDQLRRRLAQPLGESERRLVLCNMERCRWRLSDYPWRHTKYVFINIASQHLDAVDGDNVLTMRIGCGAQQTKTPLLTSRIKRLDVNPQWIIPRSIIKKSIAHRAGDTHYFESHRYFIRDRKTGKEVSPALATPAMLADPNYLVIQRGGTGNALGSIIFRFDNNFSVYLHDTSNRGVFSNADRSVSHGCIRVERPFDLAAFLLAGKDDMIDRVRYSMTFYDDKSGLDEKEVERMKDKQRFVRSVDVSPQIPLFITYYTLYPDRQGVLRTYPDIYGYDPLIYENLKKYL